MKNSYLENSIVSLFMSLRILRYFCVDLTVSQISVSSHGQKIRQRIYDLS